MQLIHTSPFVAILLAVGGQLASAQSDFGPIPKATVPTFPPRGVWFFLYGHDDGSAEKEICFWAHWGDPAKVTVHSKPYGKDETKTHTFTLTADELNRFWNGFEKVEVVRKARIGDEETEPDTETHHVFALFETVNLGQRNTVYGIPQKDANDEFKSWLGLIDRNEAKK